jgi:DNA-binding transcriptional MerR regulator
MTARPDIPEGKDEFKLNEVCKLANVQPYMLRFWGSEFPQLEAGRSGSGQRLYSRDQVGLILEIRRLLFDEGLTIAGARKRLNSAKEPPPPNGKPAPPAEEPPATKPKKAAKPKKKAAAKKMPEPEPERPAAEAAEVDKTPPEDVQPLLATLRKVRKDLAAIVADLET